MHAREVIANSTNKISAIDAIAFQTNIVALNVAVLRMDEITQQNTALVEQAAAAAQRLQD